MSGQGEPTLDVARTDFRPRTESNAFRGGSTRLGSNVDHASAGASTIQSCGGGALNDFDVFDVARVDVRQRTLKWDAVQKVKRLLRASRCVQRNGAAQYY